MRTFTIIFISILILIFIISCSKTQQTGIGGTLTEKKVCNCQNTPQPVCGNDGKQYSNSCFAGCAGVSFRERKC